MISRESPGAAVDVSIVVPLLNEAALVPKLIKQLGMLEAKQIIIVDGGSSDDTPTLIREAGYQLIESPSGRAKQMNAGARVAMGEMLLFLHADTELPKNYRSELSQAEVWGRFDICFSSSLRVMKMVAFFINLRSRVSGVATGDQAIFVDRDVFASMGGFPDFPIMEDVALCKRLRQLHRPYCSLEKVTTSARRWEHNGVLNTILKMWWYRLAYFFGASPHKIKQGYGDVR